MSESGAAPVDPVEVVEELDPVTVADRPREPTEYEKRLRRENAAERVKRRAAETEREAAKVQIEAVRAEVAVAVQRARDDARAEANDRIMRAELKAAATAAGLVDLDAIKLLDLSAVKLDDAGAIVIPDQFFEKAKAAKPYLFGKPATTSTIEAPPPSEPPAAKRATDMTAAEFAALQKSLGIRV